MAKIKINTWQIIVRNKNSPKSKFQVERFLTGGQKFTSFKSAQEVKKKLQNMSSSLIYKIIKN